MSPRYREVLEYLKDVTDRAALILRTQPEICAECGGQVRAVETKFTAAFRVDGCCVDCGGSEVHRAGWLDREVRDLYRARTKSLLIG